jgi:transposase
MTARLSEYRDWKEWRRMRAAELKREGWSQREIADALDVSGPAVSHWHAVAEADGVAALRSHPAAGRAPLLTAEQKRLIPELLWHGPEAYSFRGQVRTCARIALVFEEEFGVRCHKDHAGRSLKELGWTPQIPIRRAVQRDESAIRRWRAEVWPELFRRARREHRVLVFEDESGFYLLPGLVRTYAPKGCTPVIREKATRDHLSVMGGMTPEGKVYTLVRQEPLNGSHRIEFLIHLRRVAGGRLLVVWDGSPIH